MKSKKLVMMALITGVLMLTFSTIASVSGYGTVSGWGRVRRTRGPATLSMNVGSGPEGEKPDHTGLKYVLLTVNDVTYGWEITKVKQCRNSLIVRARSLGGHEALGVDPGPGWLVAIVRGHGASNKVVAFGRSTFFVGSEECP